MVQLSFPFFFFSPPSCTRIRSVHVESADSVSAFCWTVTVWVLAVQKGRKKKKKRSLEGRWRKQRSATRQSRKTHHCLSSNLMLSTLPFFFGFRPFPIRFRHGNCLVRVRKTSRLRLKTHPLTKPVVWLAVQLVSFPSAERTDRRIEKS